MGSRSQPGCATSDPISRSHVLAWSKSRSSLNVYMCRSRSQFQASYLQSLCSPAVPSQSLSSVPSPPPKEAKAKSNVRNLPNALAMSRHGVEHGVPAMAAMAAVAARPPPSGRSQPSSDFGGRVSGRGRGLVTCVCFCWTKVLLEVSPIP